MTQLQKKTIWTQKHKLTLVLLLSVIELHQWEGPLQGHALPTHKHSPSIHVGEWQSAEAGVKLFQKWTYNPRFCLCKQQIDLMVSTSFWLHPPKDSTTRGTKASDFGWQELSELSVVSWWQLRLGQLVCHSFKKGDTGWQDKNWLQELAMALPSCRPKQQMRQQQAGHPWVSESWRWMRSPLLPQLTWWSPKHCSQQLSARLHV